MRWQRSLFSMAFIFATTLVATVARAGEDDEDPRDLVVAYNVGFRWGISPSFFIPTNGGKGGFGLSVDARYGIELGPMIMAPGVSLAGFFPDGGSILIGLATMRLTFPVGPVGPYVLGGGGVGSVSQPSATGPAYLGGVGFMVHAGHHFGIGAQATYEGIGGTDFRAISIGPTFFIAF